MRFRLLPPVLLASLVLALTLSCASFASARDTAKPPPGYADAINQAISELEANNYPEALAEFRRAHEIFPNARTLRGLGMVEFELRHYAESKRLLEQALAATVKPLDDKLKSETQALLDRARRYLSELVVQFSPASATVTVDGGSGELSSQGTYELEVGEHVVEVRAAGYATERRTINVKGGERLALRIRLESLSAPASAAEVPAQRGPAPGAPPVDTAPASKPAYKKWWVWTTVGVVVAGGAVAAALLLKRKQEEEPVRGPNAVPNVMLQSLESTR